MRPVVIADVALPRVGWISHVPKVGWIATHPAESSATVLDAELRVIVRVELPVRAQKFVASVSHDHLAVVTLDELQVYDRLGQVLWRHEHPIPGAGMPCAANCYLDAHGVLWVYLSSASGDVLIAHDAAVGTELDRVRLDSSVGAAFFFPHPDGSRLGLHVAMGQDYPLSQLVWLAERKICSRNLPGGFVNGFSPTGDRYLALPHLDLPEISVREVSTGAIVVARDSRNIPGYHSDSEYQLMEAGALVSDDFVLVAVVDEDSDFENHLLLSARSLRWQVSVDYGFDMIQNAVAATDGRSRWLTQGADATVRLWQLPDRITDESPGQLDLW